MGKAKIRPFTVAGDFFGRARVSHPAILIS